MLIFFRPQNDEVTKCVTVTMERSDQIILIFLVYRYKTCVVIRLRVKSEGMSSTLFTMELTNNSFTKMFDFEVYRLP